MKSLVTIISLALILAFVGCTSGTSSTSDTNDTNDTTIIPDTNDTTVSELKCTTSFGNSVVFDVPTKEQLVLYAGEYVGEVGVFNDAFEWVPSGDALINYSDTGVFVYNGTTQSVVETCYIPNDKMIYLVFANGGHLDLFENHKFSGISPEDANLIIQNINLNN